MKLRALLGVCALLLTAAGPASAHRRNFTFSYDWFTPLQNEKEIEFWWTQERGGNADYLLEFEYGVTSRYVVAPYLIVTREHGDKWEVAGGKLEQRYRFGSFKERRLLPALYFEVVKERREPWELESKLILSYVFGRNIWSFNLIPEQELKSHEPLEWGYATGLAHYLKGGVYGKATWVGVELFGNLTTREHRGGPVLGHSFTPSDHLLLTGGFGLNHRSDAQVRLIFEHEWF